MNTLQSFIVIAGAPLLVFFIILIPGMIKAAKGLYRSEKHRIDNGNSFIEEEPVEDKHTIPVEVNSTGDQDPVRPT